MIILKIPHRRRNYTIPAAFAVAVILCAICFVSRAFGASSFLSGGLSVIVSPLQSCTKSIYDGVSSLGDYLDGIDELKEENEKLTLENKKLTEQNSKVKKLEAENESLHKFLEIKKEHTDFKYASGNIIARSLSGYSGTFTIDKGSAHGIKAGLPIISEEGALVGITHSVDVSSTVCKSIISYDINVGVYSENSGETSIMSGSFDVFKNKKCIIKELASDSKISVGDTILTSGYGETYPRGLKIGTVEKLVPEAGSHSMSAVVKLEDSSITCDRIMVITSFKEAYN